jgi:hypothetical protein
VDGSTGAPTAYWYAIQEEVALLPGESQENPVPLKLEPATEAFQTKCTVHLPANYDLLGSYVGASFPSRGIAFRLFRDDTSAAGLATGEPYTTTYLLPKIPGASVQVCAVAADSRDYFAGSASVTCADATGLPEVEIDVQRSLQPFSPARGANDVTLATRYAWTGFEGGVHMARFTPLDGAAPRYYVFTAATSAVIPDLSAVVNEDLLDRVLGDLSQKASQLFSQTEIRPQERKDIRADHRNIDRIPGLSQKQKVDNLLGNGNGHVLLGFSGGGPEMGRGDHPFQFEKRIPDGRLLFKNVQGRS